MGNAWRTALNVVLEITEMTRVRAHVCACASSIGQKELKFTKKAWDLPVNPPSV